MTAVTHRSNVFMLGAGNVQPGLCGLCGATTLLRFHDATTGLKTGACCKGFMAETDLFLSKRAARFGLRQPTPEEFGPGKLPNN
jgi:hypothetical protein